MHTHSLVTHEVVPFLPWSRISKGGFLLPWVVLLTPSVCMSKVTPTRPVSSEQREEHFPQRRLYYQEQKRDLGKEK